MLARIDFYCTDNLNAMVKQIGPIFLTPPDSCLTLGGSDACSNLARRHQTTPLCVSYNNNNTRVLTGFCPTSDPQLTLALHVTSRAT